MTFKIFKKIFILLFFLNPLLVYAQDVSLKAYLEKDKVSLDENVVLFVEAHNLKEDTNAITPPLLENFMIVKADTYNKFIKDPAGIDSSIVKIFRFLLEPLKEGNFKIAPFSLKTNNIKIKSNSIFVGVEKAKFSEDMPIEYSYKTTEQDKLKNDFILKSFIDNNLIFKGQQIVIGFEFIRPVLTQISSLKYTYPSFKNFIAEPLPSKIKPEVFTLNNNLYKKEMVSFALFPVSTGTYNIDSAYIDFNIMLYQEDTGNYLHETVKLSSKNHTLKVLPLPEKENISNMVGVCDNLIINFRCSNKEISLDSFFIIEIEITGTGFLEKKEFNVTDKSNYFEEHLILDEIQTAVDETNNIFTKRVIKKKLVPLKAGDFNLDNIIVTYFSPSLKEYKNIKLPQLTINVINNKKKQTVEKAADTKILEYNLKDIKNDLNIFMLLIKNPLTLFVIVLSGFICLLILLSVVKKIKHNKLNKKEKNPIQRSGRNKHRRL